MRYMHHIDGDPNNNDLSNLLVLDNMEPAPPAPPEKRDYSLAVLLLLAAFCLLGLTLYDFYLDGQRDQRAYNARMAAYMALPDSVRQGQ